MTYRLGFDIGGTFTDLILVDDARGTVHREKVPTTPDDISQCAITGITKLCERAGVAYDDLSHISHGTTVATNALLEREGAKTGLITTEGFRDSLAIGREKRSEIYDLAPTKPPTFAERRYRRGVPERVAADGSVIEPLDEDDAIELIRTFDAAGVESVAVSLLHAYRSPAHERRIAELIEEHSELSVSLSSNVMNELNEYERTLSTTIDAYVSPLIDTYVDRLRTELAALGIDETIHLMQANGGVVTPETIGGRRLRLVNSGPAAGVLGAKQVAAEADDADIITLDMGGTSTDTCVVTDSTIETTTEGSIQDIPLLFPQIDVRSIGTGGGSIAHVDRAGVLKVGPASAGATPGPACYGRGGTEPTVTDAAVHLGYLNPRNFLGGEMELDVDAAERVLRPLAADLDIDVTELAAGIHEIVVTSMVGGIRQVTVEKGYDPRDFSLVCYGGAGPLFGDFLARKLGIERVLIPPASGILSAFGLVTADRRFDFTQSQPLLLTRDNLEEIASIRESLRAKATDVDPTLELNWSVDLRYHGQTFDLNVAVPQGRLDDSGLATLVERFESMYDSVFGIVNEDDPVEAVTWRLQAVDPTENVELSIGDRDRSVATARRGTRNAYDQGAFVDFDVFSRYDLPVGRSLRGPAIVEEAETTTVVGGGTVFRVDSGGNLILELEA